MILDLERFVREERPYWRELDQFLEARAKRVEATMDLHQARRFYYLYRRAASDLVRIGNCAAEPAIRAYLEGLVSGAYAEIQGVREHPNRLRPCRWFFYTFPQSVRRHYLAFAVALAAIVIGIVFGSGAIAYDPEAKQVLVPFGYLEGSPAERVAKEEARTEDRLEGHKSTFAAVLMTNNIRVSIAALALGLTCGFGTILMLFYNGIILGAVALDYIFAHQTAFLAGWLLPHGSVEIPAVLIAGQAGLVLGGAIIGWENPLSLRERLRIVGPDLVTLIFGVALMLVWAGIVEAFFSQYHAPTLPYALKIAFGALQLTFVCIFFVFAGKSRTTPSHSEPDNV